MSEATQQVQENEQPAVPNNQVEVDQYEVQAREQGWKPKEEYEGDPNKWRPAKEFVERGELFSKIDTMGKELKETKKALKMLQEHNEKIKETEYQRAVEELRSLQKQHLETGNSDEYLRTTELLTDLKAEQKAREVVKSTKSPEADPRFVDWQAKNSWYTKDDEMRKFADIVGTGYAQANPGLDPEEVLDYVTVQVKERFKNKFENPKRTQATAVEGTSQSSGKKVDSIELSDDERKVMNTFIRMGVMSKEEYLNQVKQLRGGK